MEIAQIKINPRNPRKIGKEALDKLMAWN